MTYRLRLLSLLAALAVVTGAGPRAKHVFIVSIDGGKPSVMRRSAMPTLFSSYVRGAHTWEAQTVLPSVTLVSHASMLTGVTPARHAISWNDYKPERGIVKVPTVFSLAKAKGLRTAMFVNKKLMHLDIPGSLDRFVHPGFTAKRAAASFTESIQASKPNLCFIHFADPDSAGHSKGWGSPEQKQAFADSDQALKVILQAIRKAGIEKSSVVLITADHGGHGKRHGSDSPEDMIIPWIAWGAGVRCGHTIKGRVTTYDTAATALWLLDVPVPADWDGKPVTSAFLSQVVR